MRHTQQVRHDYPVISERSNGDRLVGDRGPFAVDLYAAGTPPMHGFAARGPISPRVSRIRIGDELRVERHGDAWVALDEEGIIGQLRWRPSEEGKPVVHGVADGPLIRLPDRGVLRIRRLVLNRHGEVKDVGGDVAPS